MIPGGYQRYYRQMIVDGWGESAQKILSRSSVLIVGAGGLGSAASMYLAAAGVGRLVVCDYDHVEITNLNRQLLHDESSLGKPKTESAHSRLAALNSTVEIRTFSEKITDDTVAAAAGDCTVIVDCLDNLTTRYVLNRYSVQTGIPLVHAGLGGMNGQITVFEPGKGPCLSCLFPEDLSHADGGKPIPVVGAAVGVLSSMQALETLKLLTGLGQSLVGRLLIYNGLEGIFEEVRLSRNPECPVCGAESAIQ